MKQIYIVLLSIFTLLFSSILAQKKNNVVAAKDNSWKSETFNGLKFRSIGTAVTSGRVVDFAVDPNNSKTYFLAAACGGVWKTSNSGNSYEPVLSFRMGIAFKSNVFL